MKKKELPRLTLNRETIRRLNDPTLSQLVNGGGDLPPSSQWICCPGTTT